MIVLYGKSGTGKSTIEKILKEKYGLSKCVSYTTRKMREGEVNGVDYHFVNKERFDILLLNGDMLEYTMFDNNYYGVAKSDIPEYSCLVAEPHGVSQILNSKHIIKPYVVNLMAPDDELKQRMIDRGDSEGAIKKRITNDKSAFDPTKHNIVPNLLLGTKGRDPEELAEVIYNKFIDNVILDDKFIKNVITYKTKK